MTPDQYARKADRLKALEALDADVLSKPDPARTAEIGQLKSELFGTQNVGAQAQPQMPPPGGAQVLQPPNATATGPFDSPVASFNSEAEALAAANAGKIPMGPDGIAVVIVNGQRYRLRSK